MENKKTALIVEGGGQRGVFSFGITDTFINRNYDPFDIYMGVSNGVAVLCWYLIRDTDNNLEKMLYAAKGDYLSYKNIFIGSDAARQEKENGPNLKRVSFIIEAEDADVMGDEPIWANVPKGEFTKFITETKSGGSPTRFDNNGKAYSKIETNNSDGDWNVVGWVTSGGYGHHVDLSLAQGYIPFSLFKKHSEKKFQVEILGKKYNARISIDAPFDPSGSVMRG